jgi:hypothetical protein
VGNEKYELCLLSRSKNGDSFTLRQSDETETVVILTSTTKIKAAKKSWFRRAKPANGSSMLRGLQVKAEGTRKGQLVAARIRFNERDFKAAQSLEARVNPVETLATSTKVLAESNQTHHCS